MDLNTMKSDAREAPPPARGPRRIAPKESRMRERRTSHEALHDGVTGLPNLALFKDRLESALAQAQRHDWRLAVLFLDLEAFKSINERHGREVGDRVLKVVAQRLQALLRGGDTVAHRGGDEFLFLALEARDEANVLAFAGTILERIAQACEVDGASLTVGASIGIAVYPEDGRSGRELLRHADLAMCAAIEQKKGVMLHSQMPR